MVPQQHFSSGLSLSVCVCAGWGFAGVGSWSEDENGGGKVLFDEFCKWAASKKLQLELGRIFLGCKKEQQTSYKAHRLMTDWIFEK